MLSVPQVIHWTMGSSPPIFPFSSHHIHVKAAYHLPPGKTTRIPLPPLAPRVTYSSTSDSPSTSSTLPPPLPPPLRLTHDGGPNHRHASTRLDQPSHRAVRETRHSSRLLILTDAHSAEEDQKDMLTRSRLRGPYL